MKELQVPNMLWHGNKTRRLTFPDRWDLTMVRPPGFDKPAMSSEAIAKAIASPLGSPNLSELASTAKETCIVFDDNTRPTPVYKVLPHVLKALHDAGIQRENIRFIPALGLHGAMTNIDFRKKLGDDIVANYAIYNHNPYENCDYLGKTRQGTPVHINREFMECDLKIGIGCVTPHIHVGFGGGGKIVFPGISGVESAHHFHSKVFQSAPERSGLGNFENNVMYREVVEASRMAGLQFIANALINDKGQITDLFAGDLLSAHQKAAEAAKIHYACPPVEKQDIVVANAYAKANEMAICMFLAMKAVNPEKGVVVLLVDSPEGQVCHYLFRSFGKNYGGRMFKPPGTSGFATATGNVKLLVCSRYPDPTMCDLFSSPRNYQTMETWEETLGFLEEQFPEKASSAVICDGTVLYFQEG